MSPRNRQNLPNFEMMEEENLNGISPCFRDAVMSAPVLNPLHPSSHRTPAAGVGGRSHETHFTGQKTVDTCLLQCHSTRGGGQPDTALCGSGHESRVLSVLLTVARPTKELNF